MQGRTVRIKRPGNDQLIDSPKFILLPGAMLVAQPSSDESALANKPPHTHMGTSDSAMGVSGRSANIRQVPDQLFTHLTITRRSWRTQTKCASVRVCLPLPDDMV
jgi:hypothetical protein